MKTLNIHVVFIFCALFSLCTYGRGDEVRFNNALLYGANGLDTSNFSEINILKPGKHRVLLKVNDVNKGSMLIEFLPGDSDKDAIPCFSEYQLKNLGISFNKESDDAIKNKNYKNTYCLKLNDLTSDAVVNYDFYTGEVAIKLPQIYIKHHDIDDSKELWSNGANAMMMNYNIYYSGSNILKNKNNSSNYFSVFFDNGISTESGWYLKNSGVLNYISGEYNYHSQRTTIQHDVTDIDARFVVGQIYTGSEYFNSYNIKGAMLSTDKSMWPDSQRQYRPTVEGVAGSDALVKIYQGNYLIYQKNMPKGAFSISDYTPAGYGGSLDVVIEESGGVTQTYSIPFNTSVNLIRKKQYTFSFITGEYDNKGLSFTKKPIVSQVGINYGLTDFINAHGGVMYSGNYSSGQVGISTDTKIGAFRNDITYSVTNPPSADDTEHGYSYKVSYYKKLNGYNTGVSIAALRYNSKSFWLLSDAVSTKPKSEIYKLKDTFSLNINQPLNGYGNVGLMLNHNNYWRNNNKDKDFTYGASYQGSFQRGINYSLRFTKFSDDKQISMMATIPLGLSGHSRISADYLRSHNYGYNLSTRIDSASESTEGLTYGASVTKAEDNHTGLGGRVSYTGKYGLISSDYSEFGEYDNLNINAYGGIVLYGNNLIFGQSSSDTIGVIDAPYAANAKINGLINGTLDKNGYGLVNLAPYYTNTLEVSPENIPLNVDLKSNTVNVIPRSGAIVPVKFDTELKNNSAILKISKKLKLYFKFGELIKNEQGGSLGVIGQSEIVLLDNIKDNGIIKIKSSSGDICTFNYSLSDNKILGLKSISLTDCVWSQ